MPDDRPKIAPHIPFSGARRHSYPGVEQFLDAFYHERVNGDPKPMEEYLRQVQVVKQRIRKPKP